MKECVPHSMSNLLQGKQSQEAAQVVFCVGSVSGRDPTNLHNLLSSQCVVTI